MSYGVGRRGSSNLALLWLWCRPAATALIRPLAWEPPYAAGAGLKKCQKKKVDIQKLVPWKDQQINKLLAEPIKKQKTKNELPVSEMREYHYSPTNIKLRKGILLVTVANIFSNLGEMDTLLEKYSLLKVTQKQTKSEYHLAIKEIKLLAEFPSWRNRNESD